MTIVKQGRIVNLIIALYLPLFLWVLASIPMRTTFIFTSKKETLHQHISVANISLTLITNNENDDSEKCDLGMYDNVIKSVT